MPRDDDAIVIPSDDEEKEERRTSNGSTHSMCSLSQEIDITQSDASEEEDLVLVSHVSKISRQPSSFNFDWDDDDLLPLNERLGASKCHSSEENGIIDEVLQAERRPLHEISDSDADEVPDIGPQIHGDSPRMPSRLSDVEVVEIEASDAAPSAERFDGGGTEGDPVPDAAEDRTSVDRETENMTRIRTKRTREEKEALRLQKEEQKRRKAIEREVARSCRLADCVKYMRVTLDKHLAEMASFDEVVDALHQLDAQTTVAELPIECGVLWARKIVSPDPTSATGTTSSEIEEEEFAEVLTADRFLYLVGAEMQRRLGADGCGTLTDHLDVVGSRHPGKRITCFVLGLEKYFSQEKKRQNQEHRAQILGVAPRPGKRKNGLAYDGPSLSREEVEAVVLGLQLVRPFNVYYVDGLAQVARWLAAFTKAIAEKPFRLEKQRRSLNFLAPGGGSGRKHEDPALVWRSQIEQFPNVGKDVAEAIVARYRSPRALAEAYRDCRSNETARLLLEDIVVRRGDGPLATTRRVGPKLSARIHHLFTAQDADAYFD